MFPQGLKEAVSGLPPTFWYVWGGTLVNRLGSFVVPFLALYLTDQRNLSTAEAGAIVSLFGLGALIAAPVGGWLADRIGRKPTLLLGLVLASFCMLALGFSRTPALIAVSTFFLGLTSELYRPAVSAVVADVVPPEGRLKAYAALYWAANLGFSVAPVIAGFMAKRSYQALFIADAATTLLYAAVVLWKVPETRPQERQPPVAGTAQLLTFGSTQPQTWGYLRKVWERVGFAEVGRDGVFLTFALLTFLLSMLFMQHNATLALDMRAHDISTETYGLILATNGALIVLFQPIAARWVHGFRRSHVLAAAALLTGLGFGVNAWAQAAPLYVAGVIIWTAGEILHSPVSSALVADLAPAHARGRYQGVFAMAFGSALFAGPFIGSWVMQRFGADALWLGCLALGAAVAVAHLLVAAPRRRRIEALRQAGFTEAHGAAE